MNGKSRKLDFLKGKYGFYAIASLLICSLSGVLLAIPYDVVNPYESISRLMLFNPAASFFRNIHYWSAQFFLVLTILHIWDHFRKDKGEKVKRPVWLRLAFSIIVVFFVMLSGFILKGDADALQARRILDSLIVSIPLIGKTLSYTLLGNENSFLLIYVHHIATATIILFIFIYEHARTIWGKRDIFIIALAIFIILSFFIPAPLNDMLNPVVKGPWYFTGLQEVLHWMGHPGWSILIIFIFLLMIYYYPVLKPTFQLITKRTIYISFFLYILLTLFALFFRGENWSFTHPFRKNYLEQIWLPKIEFPSFFHKVEIKSQPDSYKVFNRMEGCLVCHEEMQGFSPSHSPEAIGCVSCHRGNPFSLNKIASHRNMIRIPGNLEDAGRSCGLTDCHPDIVSRVDRSIMTTASGMVSVDKWAFGESDHPSQLSDIRLIKKSPADKHLRNLCASCHLGNSKTEYGELDQKSRGGGCLACHLNYAKQGKSELERWNRTSYRNKFNFRFHPSLDLNVSNEHCFGCHSRSGRISTNYEGWHETQLKPEQIKDKNGYRILEDQRVFTYEGADIHHQKGMLCIDCHTSYELMGDGKLHEHKEEQVKVHCKDCHFNQKPKTKKLDELDAENRKIYDLRKYGSKNQQFLTNARDGRAILNTFIRNDSAFMISKANGCLHVMKPPTASCQADKAHSRLSCESCHTAWVPRCIGCHNQFEPSTRGKDLLSGKKTKGAWIEFAGGFESGQPTLAVFREGNVTGIKPVMPGMIMTIGDDKNKDRFERLFAPASSHTIIKPAKNCKYCHTSPMILGYGRGELLFSKTDSKWSFTPNFENNRNDNLPEDAWIGFLQYRKSRVATRSNIVPFTVQEQKKILTVGVCLECHDDHSEVMMRSLNDFESQLKSRIASCLLPKWNN